METNRQIPHEACLEQRYALQADPPRRRCQDRERLRADLGEELELRQGALLDQLLDLGVTAGTAAAFEALPLVEVAWADGEIDDEERWCVLATATAFGLELGRPAHAQLELWLKRRPAPELFSAWVQFARRGLTRRRAAPRVRRLLEGAHEVASAAGGILGFKAISRAEHEAVSRIREAVAADGDVHAG